MSTTLATVAEALIDFILSLLRDPDAAAEFEEDPQGALAARGLSDVSHMDACAVAPIVIDRPDVVPRVADPGPAAVTVVRPTTNTAVNEIQNIVNNFAWLTNHSTVVDQSTNQNIWAGGDVTQIFDQEANVASGEDSIAAGDDVSIEQTQNDTTNINAGDDVNIGNDTDVTVIDDSYNQTTDNSQTTDASETTTVTDSGNTTTTTTTTADAGGDDTAASSSAAPVEPIEAAPEPVPAYTETPVESSTDDAVEGDLAMSGEMPVDDDI
ncbi:IniB N-terminal domain-containing protein [Microbacterium sp. 179-I 3D4 NHS]|uniref:IniB N-terminal domain-containing protein n=1 Tax=Microbacterium sp. 179-I 3D4 NHS TaxID=3142381 RepID=UPI00399EF3EF